MRRSLPAILLVPFLAGAAWYTLEASLRSEREYTAFVHAIGEGENVRVLDSRFERGWLRSRAETSIELSGGTGLLFRAAVVSLGATDVRSRIGAHMVHQIDHGLLPLFEWIREGCQGHPLLARIDSTVALDQESQLALADAVGKLPSLEAETELRLGSPAETTFSVGPQRLHAKGEGFERTGRWLGLDGELRFAEGFHGASGFARAPGLEGRGLEQALDIHDMIWHFDLSDTPTKPARVRLEIASVRLDQLAAPGWLLEDVALAAEDATGAGALTLRAARIGVGAETWGPGSLKLRLEGGSAAALEGLRRAAERLQQQAAHESGGDEEAAENPAADVLEALPELLAEAPRLTLEYLKLSTPRGGLALQGSMGLVAPELRAASLTPASFLHASFDGQTSVALVEAWLAARIRAELGAQTGGALDPAALEKRISERRATALRGLIDSGTLVRDGDSAELHIAWQGSAGTGGPPSTAAPPSEAPKAPLAARAEGTAPARRARAHPAPSPDAPAAGTPLPAAPSPGEALPRAAESAPGPASPGDPIP
jgi:Bacterial protein of unknown function (DUF945)